jgi:hypothetical protein
MCENQKGKVLPGQLGFPVSLCLCGEKLNQDSTRFGGKPGHLMQSSVIQRTQSARRESRGPVRFHGLRKTDGKLKAAQPESGVELIGKRIRYIRAC